MGELHDEGSIGEVGVARFIVNHEQVVSRTVDVIESKVDQETIGQIVVLEGRTGEPIVGEVVIDPDIAHA